jgi:hypothetical protein
MPYYRSGPKEKSEKYQAFVLIRLGCDEKK